MSVAPTLHILLVEDNPADARLILEVLSEVEGSLFSLRRVDRLSPGLESLSRDPTDLLLLDLMLPDSVGLDTFTRARAHAGNVPIVVLSGLEDKSLALEAVGQGAEDFLVKGQIDPQALARTLHLAIERSRRARAERELSVAQEQLRVARSIQQKLFPSGRRQPLALDIAGATRPAEETGGDYFDYFAMPGGAYGVVIGDVSGNGIGPTILMAETRAYLRALAEAHSDPGEILSLGNRLLFEDTNGYHFVSVFFASIRPADHTLVYANAGRLGYLISQKGEVETLGTMELVLGVSEGAAFQSSPPIDFDADDVLLLATNGLVEARSPDGEAFGAERMLNVAIECREKSAAAILDTLERTVSDFTAGQSQEDDLTAVVVKLRSPAA